MRDPETVEIFRQINRHITQAMLIQIATIAALIGAILAALLS